MAGLGLGVIVATNPFYSPLISFPAGIATWAADLAFVLALSGNPVGLRAGALVAGLFLAVPSLVQAMPLPRALLMCLMAVPFVAATALVSIRPITGWRARLVYLCEWCGGRPPRRQSRRFDAAAGQKLFLAIAVFAAAMLAVKATPNPGLGCGLRWFAGGILLLAVAEMITAGHHFMTAFMGVEVPPLFRSPYRSASVGEFWTQRWNLPTARLLRNYCFAPLVRHGIWLALSVTFFVSAVGHLLLAYFCLGRWGISLMCGAFFMVQPLLIAAERWLGVRRRRPVTRHAWTLTILAITSPLFVEPALQVFEKSWGGPDTVLLPVMITLVCAVGFCGVISWVGLETCRGNDTNSKR